MFIRARVNNGGASALSPSTLLGRFLEVSGFHEGHCRYIDMPAHCFDDLLRRQSLDFLLQVGVPCHCAVVERQRTKSSHELAILRPADLLSLDPAILRRGDFRGGIAVLKNQRDLVTERSFDLRGIFGRGNGVSEETGVVFLRSDAERRVDSVAETFFAADTRKQPRIDS